MLDRIFFAPDDGQGDGASAPADSGGSFDAAASAAMDGGSSGISDGGGDAAPPTPFFTYEDEGGEKLEFHSPEELKKVFRENRMRRKDYTQKTQRLAEQRKQFEQQRDTIMSEILEQKKKYDEMNKFLRDNPHIYRKLQEERKRGTTGDVAVERARAYVDETKSELQKELEEIKNWRKQREFQEYRDRIYGEMESEFPDFNREAIQSLMGEIDPRDMKSLVRLVYDAYRGRNMSVDQQARKAESQQRKQAARLVPGGGAPVQGAIEADSLDEAYNKAMREIQSG